MRVKACPLCGSKAEVKNTEHLEQVCCPNCGASTLWQPNAREYWNKRTRKQTNLKPCPICGGVGKVWETYERKYCVQCRKCHFTSGDVRDFQEAVEAWNRRTNDEGEND